MSFAIDGWKVSSGTQMWPTILKCVACFFEVLKSVIERNYPRNFLTHFPPGFTSEKMSAVRISSAAKIKKNFPFRASLSNFTWNFRSEYNSPLRDRFCSTVILLVTCLGWQENHFLFCFDEHLICE